MSIVLNKEGRTVDAGQCADELLQLRTKVAKLELLGMNTIDRDAVIEECAKVCEGMFIGQHGGVRVASLRCTDALRALKSQPAQPDPRDEALRVARESIARIEQPLANIADVLSVNSAVKEANNGLRLLNKAIAAIDALIGDN